MRTIRPRKPLLAGTVATALACLLVVAAQTSARESSANAAAAPVTITGTSLSGYTFAPARRTVKAGARVTWSWQSDAPHNVTFNDGKASATANPGSFKRRFKAPGTYKYLCTIHGFRGKIVVRGN